MSGVYRAMRNYQNQQIRIYDGDEVEPEYGFPIVRNNVSLTQEEIAASKWIGFNELLSTKADLSDCIVHFFIDDYQFDRLWNRPLEYIPKLKKCKAVVMTDFSMYSDFPKALSIYSKFKNHWLARFMQDEGIQVIPVLCWSGEDTFDFCFKGYDKDCKLFAISTQGCFADKEAKDKFFGGLYQADGNIKPETIMIYVDDKSKRLVDVKEVSNPIRSSVVFIKNEQINRLRRIKADVKS